MGGVNVARAVLGGDEAQSTDPQLYAKISTNYLLHSLPTANRPIADGLSLSHSAVAGVRPISRPGTAGGGKEAWWDVEADMRLADFILRNMEGILAEWEAFATTLLPASASMTTLALRDHAQQILQAVVRDISTPQTCQEQSDKSKGRGKRPPTAPQTAAETHAVLRAKSGFDINQLVAEYRTKGQRPPPVDGSLSAPRH